MQLAEYCLAGAVLLVTFLFLIARRIRLAVVEYAFQSFLLATLTFLLAAQLGLWHLYVLGATTVVVKGIVIPMVLRHQVRDTVYDRRETEYHVGFPSALLLGAFLSVVGFVAANRLPVAQGPLVEPALGIGLTVLLLGFFSTLARRDAAMQLTGLLLAENGLVLLGLVLDVGLPLLVDFAIFLDVLIGAVVMGFLVARMDERLTSTDTSELRRLRG